jgi:soluble lytic murein transglycosylase
LLTAALVLVVLVVGAVAYVVLSGKLIVPVVTEKVYPIHYPTYIGQASEKYGVDPYLLAAVASSESGFNAGAVSRMGAVGLMQLMPSTAKWIVRQSSWQDGGNPNLSDPRDSLDLGACYLAYLLKRFDGSVRLTLAAYNAGFAKVDKWLQTADAPGTLQLSEIPFGETRAFVSRVERYRALYVKIHPNIFGQTSSGS